MADDLPITHPGQGEPVTFPGQDQGEPGDEHILAALEDMSQPAVGMVGIGDQSKVVAPGAAPVSAPPEQGSQRKSINVSASSSGVTDAGIRRTDKLANKWQRQADVKNAADYAQAEADQAELGMAYEAKKEALRKDAEYKTQSLLRVADINAQEASMQRAAAAAEEIAQARAQQEAHAYIAAYKQDMVAVRALMAQSGNPLSKVSGFQGAALTMASAAQGYLAARYGIKIDVNSQVDRWVEREMEQHQLAIRNQTAAAESNLTLYGLARQGAQDEWEARQRTRGFLLDNLKAQVQVEAGRYGSQAANADAAAKMADIDFAQTTNDIALRDKVAERAFKRDQLAVEAHYKQGMISIEHARVGVAKAEAEARRLAAENEARAKKAEKPTPPPMFFSDRSMRATDKDGKPVLNANGLPASGGKRAYVIDPRAAEWAQKDAAPIAQKATQKYNEMDEALAELRGLFSGAKGDMKGPELLRNRQSPEYRKYQQLKNYLVEYMQQDVTGAAAPDAQAARIAAWLAEDNFAQIGSNLGLIDNFRAIRQRKYNSTMASIPGVVPLQDGDFEEGGAFAGVDRYDRGDPTRPATEIMGQANWRGVAPVAASGAAELLSAGQGKNIDATEGVGPGTFAQAAFIETLPDKARADAHANLGMKGQSRGAAAAEELARRVLDPSRVNSVDIGQIAERVSDPKKAAEQAQKQSLGALAELSASDGPTRDYATFLRNLVLQDPEEARRLLEAGSAEDFYESK